MTERSHDDRPIRRVVVGVDGSPAPAAALRWAIREAAAHQADLDMVHAYHAPTRPIGSPTEPCASWAEVEETATAMVGRMLYQAVDRVEHLPRGIDQVVVNAPPARTLLHVARDADILAIGARGYGGFAGFAGRLRSAARQCTQHAGCPVVVVRAGGPLVNTSGEIVGVNTAVARSSATMEAQNIGFAIPMTTALRAVDRSVVRG